MDLSDICLQVVSFLSARDLLYFRVSSKQNLVYTESFDGDNTPIYRVGLWKKCFPKATYAKLKTKCLVEDDFRMLDLVEVLDMSRGNTVDKAFKHMPCLTQLTLEGCFQYGMLYQNSMFVYLSRLKVLFIDNNWSITDEALLYMPELTDLSILNCGHITDVGIQSLKHLNRLGLQYQWAITDKAFIGLSIQYLKVTHTQITDKGILELSKLKCLETFASPNIRGYGFRHLKHLDRIFLSDIAILDENLEEFGHIREIFFYQGMLVGTRFEHLKKMVNFCVYKTYYLDEKLDGLAELPLLRKVFIYGPDLKLPKLRQKLGNHLFMDIL
jgi:hypothetical protein